MVLSFIESSPLSLGVIPQSRALDFIRSLLRRELHQRFAHSASDCRNFRRVSLFVSMMTAVLMSNTARRPGNPRSPRTDRMHHSLSHSSSSSSSSLRVCALSFSVGSTSKEMVSRNFAKLPSSGGALVSELSGRKTRLRLFSKKSWSEVT